MVRRMDGGGIAMQDDSMDEIGRVASGTKTEQLPRATQDAKAGSGNLF